MAARSYDVTLYKTSSIDDSLFNDMVVIDHQYKIYEDSVCFLKLYSIVSLVEHGLPILQS